MKMGNKRKAIASMVLGIISVAFTMFGYAPLVLGILAVVFGGWSMKVDKDGKGMAITGLITGIVGILSGLFWSLILTAVFMAA